MPKPRFILEFSQDAVRSLPKAPSDRGKIAVALVLRNTKADTLRSLAKTFEKAANDLYDAADEEN